MFWITRKKFRKSCFKRKWIKGTLKAILCTFWIQQPAEILDNEAIPWKNCALDRDLPHCCETLRAPLQRLLGNKYFTKWILLQSLSTIRFTVYKCVEVYLWRVYHLEKKTVNSLSFPIECWCLKFSTWLMTLSGLCDRRLLNVSGNFETKVWELEKNDRKLCKQLCWVFQQQCSILCAVSVISFSFTIAYFCLVWLRRTRATKCGQILSAEFDPFSFIIYSISVIGF